jgi:hypothetical protein
MFDKKTLITVLLKFISNYKEKQEKVTFSWLHPSSRKMALAHKASSEAGAATKSVLNLYNHKMFSFSRYICI